MAVDMTGTYLWMGIFLIAAALFWGVAVWAIIRGGKDVLEIILSEHAKASKRKNADRVHST